MPDLIIHPLPFGGVAFEPVSDAGREWCQSVKGDILTDEDACMAGFPVGTIGCPAWGYVDLFGDAAHHGLVMEIEK